MFLLILGLGLAFASLDAFSEPWHSMNEAMIAETICGHFISIGLAAFCFRAAFHFGAKAAYGAAKQAGEPEI